MAARRPKKRIFYRVVSQAEFNDFAKSGKLRSGENSMEFGKHLTGSISEAIAFADMLYPDKTCRILRVTVSREVARRFVVLGRIDARGRAWFAYYPDLAGAKVQEVML